MHNHTQHDHSHISAKPWDFWLARCAILVIAGLQMFIINNFSVGPKWLVPGLELSLLIPLSIATAWTIRKAGKATEKNHFIELAGYRHAVRVAAVVLTALVTLANFASLFQLIHALLSGKAGAAPSLLLDAINIWATNVIAFALWFWNIDRGGPALRGVRPYTQPDFLFPQMAVKQFEDWTPGFIDYLFIAFTNSTAFSPADTMPLSHRAKLLMMAEASSSLLVIALVAARAVGILN
ncbi:MAG: hypothetical protein ABI230_12620 [Aestuariivirga sp.]